MNTTTDQTDQKTDPKSLPASLEQILKLLQGFSKLTAGELQVIVDHQYMILRLFKEGKLDKQILSQIFNDTYRFETCSEVLRLRQASDQIVHLELPAKPIQVSLYEAEVRFHREMPAMKWDPSKVKTMIVDGQRPNEKYPNCVYGTHVFNNVKDLPCYNANMLEFLFKKEHQHLIPEEWKIKLGWRTKRILFWGTIYGCVIRGDEDLTHVRYLSYEDGIWKEGTACIQSGRMAETWGEDYVTVVQA